MRIFRLVLILARSVAVFGARETLRSRRRLVASVITVDRKRECPWQDVLGQARTLEAAEERCSPDSQGAEGVAERLANPRKCGIGLTE